MPIADKLVKAIQKVIKPTRQPRNSQGETDGQIPIQPNNPPAGQIFAQAPPANFTDRRATKVLSSTGR